MELKKDVEELKDILSQKVRMYDDWRKDDEWIVTEIFVILPESHRFAFRIAKKIKEQGQHIFPQFTYLIASVIVTDLIYWRLSVQEVHNSGRYSRLRSETDKPRKRILQVHHHLHEWYCFHGSAAGHEEVEDWRRLEKVCIVHVGQGKRSARSMHHSRSFISWIW